jgi:translation initiation factor IF-2
MAATQTEKSGTTVIASKVYKELGLQYPDFKAKAAEIGIHVTGAIFKLSEEEIHRIKVHLGVLPQEPPAVKVSPEEAAAQARKDREEEEARKKVDDARRAYEDDVARIEKARVDAETARVNAEATAKQTRLDLIAKRLKVRVDQLDPISRTLGLVLTTHEEIDDALVERARLLETPLRLADDLKTDLKALADMGRSIGIEIGRKGFKGLSGNEEMVLSAMAKLKLKTAQERKAEVTPEQAEYQPAPPTGNKATAVIPKKETTTTASTTSAPTRRPAKIAGEAPPAPPEEDWPGRAKPGALKPAAGRSGRKRFDINEIGYDRPRAGGKRRKKGDEDDQAQAKPEIPSGPVSVTMPASLRQLSEAMGIKSNEIMARMLGEGLPVIRINDLLSKDLIEQIGIIFEREITVREPKQAEELIEEQLKVFSDEAGEAEPRSPVVTIMGHVDHGKTSLLDAIASMDRVSGESGGITQHIGAFRIDLEIADGKFKPVPGAQTDEGKPIKGKRIQVTFIDTPGHEAFTAMRARGANVTDIAVIVVSADDGMMPQTEEAIAHARAAEVEIVVAITKVDKPEANLQKVRQQLAKYNLMSPDWGGNTEIVEVSSVTKQGIDKLLQTLSDMSELLELTAVRDKPAVGTVLEAHLDIGRGIVASVVVQEGTLKRGAVIVAGHGYGRVRAMQISRGDGLYAVDHAGPGMPVEVAGLDELPEAGSRFHGMKDLKKAAEIAGMVRLQERELERTRGFSLEDWSKAKAGQAIKELVIVLKCDVQGSVETLRQELDKLTHEEVRVKVIHTGVGAITTNDVHLAEAAHGVVIGFHVGVDPLARDLADNHHVDVRNYDIIYRLIDEVRDALAGLLAPEIIETYEGTAEIRQVFKLSKVGTVAGCFMIKGAIKRAHRARLIRGGVVAWQGGIATLKRLKDDVSEVREGQECGIQLAGFDDIKQGDVIEAFSIEERARKL